MAAFEFRALRAELCMAGTKIVVPDSQKSAIESDTSNIHHHDYSGPYIRSGHELVHPRSEIQLRGTVQAPSCSVHSRKPHPATGWCHPVRGTRSHMASRSPAGLSASL